MAELPRSSGKDADPKVSYQKDTPGLKVLPQRGAVARAKAIKLRLRAQGREFSDSTELIRADRESREQT